MYVVAMLIVLLSVTGTFSCTLKFIVKDCDPNTGEADEEGYDDEYVVCNWKILTELFPMNRID